jgi:hypothetical protein
MWPAHGSHLLRPCAGKSKIILQNLAPFRGGVQFFR